MRKVFLEDLPKKGEKKLSINWAKSVGYCVKFIYDDTKGLIEIIDYYKKDNTIYLKLKYNNNIVEMKPGNLVNCKIGVLIEKIYRTHIYKVGDRIDNLLIIDLLKHKSNVSNGDRAYKYKCLIDGNIGEITEYELKRGNRCSVCAGNSLMVGYNDFATIYPHMIRYLLDSDDGKKYLKHSEKPIRTKCPNCGYIRNMNVNNLAKQGYSCPICSDGISKAEKIIISLLKQLKISFQPQASKKILGWITGRKKYDFYIPSENAIIEVNGIQHYEESARGRSLKEEQENDRLKRELALKNNIKHYIELDCRKSELDWIKNSILNSELNELFDLSQVDWNKCEDFSLSSLVKTACEIRENSNGVISCNDIANIIGLHRGTITKYLKQGAKLGWTSYDPKEEMRKSALNSYNKCKKPVEIFKDGVSLGVFESCAELSRQSEELFGVRLDYRSIASTCRGEQMQHKGYTFKYVS